MINIGLEIPNSEMTKLETFFIEELGRQVINNIVNHKDLIKLEIGKYLKQKFYAHPVVESMLDSTNLNSLAADLGLNENTPGILESIINTIINNSELIIKPIKSGKNFGIDINFGVLRNNYSDLLSIPGTSYVSKHGFDIKWLDWLLNHGDNFIIVGYRIKRHHYGKRFSRSGLAIMRKNRKFTYKLPNWIPPPDRNFLVEVMDGIENVITESIEKVI